MILFITEVTHAIRIISYKNIDSIRPVTRVAFGCVLPAIAADSTIRGRWPWKQLYVCIFKLIRNCICLMLMSTAAVAATVIRFESYYNLRYLISILLSRRPSWFIFSFAVSGIPSWLFCIIFEQFVVVVIEYRFLVSNKFF